MYSYVCMYVCNMYVFMCGFMYVFMYVDMYTPLPFWFNPLYKRITRGVLKSDFWTCCEIMRTVGF